MNTERYLFIGEATQMINASGVPTTENQMRNRTKRNQIPYIVTKNGTRLFKESDITAFIASELTKQQAREKAA